MIWKHLYHLILILCFLYSVRARFPDWLTQDIDIPTTLQKSQHGTIVLTNGLISREFSLEPGFTTTDYYSHEKESSILRAICPEAVVSLDNSFYLVGAIKSNIPRGYLNRSALAKDMEAIPNSFQYAGYDILKPIAPFPYTPRRGAPEDITWPPKGLRIDVHFKAPKGAPALHQKVIITVHYEMYDGIPAMSKWISATADPEIYNKVHFSVYSIEFLAVNQNWAEYSFFDGPYNNYGWLYIETDQSHGTRITWQNSPAAGLMPGSFEPTVNCTYDTHVNPVPSVMLDRDGFESFRVHELAVGSSHRERAALGRHRLFRLLAPHTQENPIFFHMTESSSAAFRNAIDQMADVGFEMLIYSFGSGFNLESNDPAYIKRIADDIAYAKAKGIEVGGYDLIALTRHVQSSWMAVDKQNKSIGSACFASGWYDQLLNKVLTFANKTGLSMVETDGPYGGYPCASKSHSHHEGYDDSIYKQQKLQGKFYNILRSKSVYINQPDYFFYQGGSKTGMGYNENQYSLPRWQDISISRQSVYDDTYRLIPTAGWMFVPLVVYHGGGAAAMFEPLSKHLLEYEWALAQYLGAGVAACYRGYRLYDSNETKAIVQKWVAFYKKYRDILTSDIYHLRRPDMQGIDAFMHVNYKLENKGLIMVFNPTDKQLNLNLTVPLYFTGITKAASIAEQGKNAKVYELGLDHTVEIPLAMDPMKITWFLVKST